jgi:hypothetical protein
MAQNQSQSQSGSPKKTNPIGPKWLLVLAAVAVGFLALATINKTVPTPKAPPIAPLAPASSQAAPPQPLPTDAWVGTWTGVEGLRIDIAKSEVKGDPNYKLHLFNMDGDAEYVGRPQGDVISFERGGKVETIKAGSGKDTGLKWLADKTNCLFIHPGEGFCRPEGTP